MQGCVNALTQLGYEAPSDLGIKYDVKSTGLASVNNQQSTKVLKSFLRTLTSQVCNKERKLKKKQRHCYSDPCSYSHAVNYMGKSSLFIS